MNKVLDKWKKQKTVSAHLVVQVLETESARYKELETKHKELQNSSNKHHQFLKSEIKRLKAINQKLREG